MNILSPQTMVLGKFFMAEIFLSEQLRQFAAESARIRADSGGVRQCPPDVRRTSGGDRWKLFLAEVQRICAEPGGVRAESARKVFRRGKSLNFDMILLSMLCNNYIGNILFSFMIAIKS